VFYSVTRVPVLRMLKSWFSIGKKINNVLVLNEDGSDSSFYEPLIDQQFMRNIRPFKKKHHNTMHNNTVVMQFFSLHM
jgi:hypothetical protein